MEYQAIGFQTIGVSLCNAHFKSLIHGEICGQANLQGLSDSKGEY